MEMPLIRSVRQVTPDVYSKLQEAFERGDGYGKAADYAGTTKWVAKEIRKGANPKSARSGSPLAASEIALIDQALDGGASIQEAVDASGTSRYAVEKRLEQRGLRPNYEQGGGRVTSTRYTEIVSDGLTYQVRNTRRKILGKSPGMQAAFQTLQKISRTRNVPVVIIGESGTGKELFAEAVHYGGPRRSGPYVNRNCAGIARDIMESELFGHIKGAFTGASSDKTGIFRLGTEGTVFLDEITDLPLEVQAKLLKAVENGHIVPVGYDKAEPIEVDTRVIAATSKDIIALAKQDKFRRDLLQRLAGYVIKLPALRERGEEEIIFLANSFLGEHVAQEGKQKEFEQSAYEALTEYSWPGNVRQLKMVVAGAAISTDIREKINGDDIRDRLRVWDGLLDEAPSDLDGLMDRIVAMNGIGIDHIEAAAIAAAMRKEGTKKDVCNNLGLARSTLDRKIDIYKISPDGRSYRVLKESEEPKSPESL